MADQENGTPAQMEPHLWLAESVGSWKVACFYYTESGQPPMEVQGTDHVEMFGPFWRIGRFEADMPGGKVIGTSAVGYDPNKKKFIGTWFDSSSPFLYSYQGEYDDSKAVLGMSGLNTDPTTGRDTVYRSVEHLQLPDRRTLDLFVLLADGEEFKVLTYDYTRVD